MVKTFWRKVDQSPPPLYLGREVCFYMLPFNEGVKKIDFLGDMSHIKMGVVSYSQNKHSYFFYFSFFCFLNGLREEGGYVPYKVDLILTPSIKQKASLDEATVSWGIKVERVEM